MHLSILSSCLFGGLKNRTIHGFSKRFTPLLFILLTASLAYGQMDAYPKATLNAQGIVQLPLDQELGRTYVIDLEGMAFDTEIEMVEFFSGFSDELFLYRALPGQQKAVLMLRTDARQEWSIAEWNNRLRECCEQKPLVKP